MPGIDQLVYASDIAMKEQDTLLISVTNASYTLQVVVTQKKS